MALEDHTSVRESALKLYTDVLSGLTIDRAQAWEYLLTLIESVDRSPESTEDADGIYSILADLCCELCFDELRHSCSEAFLSCIGRSHVALRIGFCVSATQRLAEMANNSALSALPPTLIECMRQLLCTLPPVNELVVLLSRDVNVCHALEVFYREAYDLTECGHSSYASDVLGLSNIHPGILLQHAEVVKMSLQPEVTADLLFSAASILPYCQAAPSAADWPQLCARLLSFDWNSVQDDSADIELVAAWMALVIQLLVRGISIDASLVPAHSANIFAVCVSALTINRLGMTAKLMTEPVDVGLLALSETNTTELTAMTSGIETLVCLVADSMLPALVQCFNSLNEAGNSLKAMVQRNVVASGIIEKELESQVAEWLICDALCFIANNLRWYSSDLEVELSGGLLKSYFASELSVIGRQIDVDVPCTENWIRAFLLSTLLRLLSNDLTAGELLSLSKTLVSSAWWCPNSRQKRLQAAYVCCHLVEQLIEGEGVEVTSSATLDPINNSQSVWEEFAKRLTDDENSLQALLSIVWTLYDETSEVPVKEWCASAYKALRKCCANSAGNRILARFESFFLNPRLTVSENET